MPPRWAAVALVAAATLSRGNSSAGAHTKMRSRTNSSALAPDCAMHGCVGLSAADALETRKTHNLKAPRCCAKAGLSSEWMRAATEANETLLRYLYPSHSIAGDLGGGDVAGAEAATIALAWRPVG